MYTKNIKQNKKGISPVITTVLLIVVAVVAVVSFQTWFKGFASQIWTDVDTQTNINGALEPKGIIDNMLYIRNGIKDNLSISSIKVGGVICYTNITLPLGMANVSLSHCLSNVSTHTPLISIATNTNLVERTVYLKPQLDQSCQLDGLTISGGSSGIFYNSSSGSVCYSQTRTCNNGVLNGSETYNHSICTVISSSLTCIIDSDDDGQISYTCAKYPMTNTTYEGDLDTDDSNSQIIDDKCWLKDNKTSCESNLDVDGCGTGTVLDKGTGLCWQRNMSTAGIMNWTLAKAYCEGLDLGGETNWKLPSKEELMTITDLSRSNTAIIGGNNNYFTNVVSVSYWTVSTYSPVAGSAWFVGFGDGNGGSNGKTATRYVTCVVRH